MQFFIQNTSLIGDVKFQEGGICLFECSIMRGEARVYV
ncbi:hypothetical protein BACCAC_03123 [Bacteroides caccae ATCC 43185]|nr:hypothetical protein BACCAC_03123 [Bacteroides caccae ATCC 43185]